jgi:hypothetical protein
MKLTAEAIEEIVVKKQLSALKAIVFLDLLFVDLREPHENDINNTNLQARN